MPQNIINLENHLSYQAESVVSREIIRKKKERSLYLLLIKGL